MSVHKNLKLLFAAFIVITIGVAFIIANANTINTSTSSQSAINEVLSIASARIVSNNINSSVVLTLQNAPIVESNITMSNFVLVNNTGALATNKVDYNITLTTGQLVLYNTSYWVNQISNTSKANYTFYDSTYIQDAPSRNVMALIIFFLALGIVVAVLAYVNWDEIKKYLG